jgi:hypothetical protein
MATPRPHYTARVRVRCAIVHSKYQVIVQSRARGLAAVLAALTLVMALADCGRREEPSPPPVPVIVQMGKWEGTGSQTLGLVSQSGRFRLRWQTRPEPGHDAAGGRFKLTVHSGVSGRPLQEVTDQRGPGEGAYNVEDDPRPFNLMVYSEGLVWTIVADEVVMARPATR